MINVTGCAKATTAVCNAHTIIRIFSNLTLDLTASSVAMAVLMEFGIDSRIALVPQASWSAEHCSARTQIDWPRAEQCSALRDSRGAGTAAFSYKGSTSCIAAGRAT